MLFIYIFTYIVGVWHRKVTTNCIKTADELKSVTDWFSRNKINKTAFLMRDPELSHWDSIIINPVLGIATIGIPIEKLDWNMLRWNFNPITNTPPGPR